jgi:hypothetical protein
MLLNNHPLVILMKTIFCPECKNPIQIVYSKEEVSDWRYCSKCGQPVYVKVDEDGNVELHTVKQAVQENSSKREMMELLEYLLRKGRARLDDLTFVVGKRVPRGIDIYSHYHLLDVDGDVYSIKPKLQKAVAEELKNYLPKSNVLGDLLKK